MSILRAEAVAAIAYPWQASATPPRTTATGLVIAPAVCRIRAVASPAMKSSRQRSKTFLARVREHAFAQVDIASLVFFRIAFGLLMTWQVWRYFSYHRIGQFWLEPPLL